MLKYFAVSDIHSFYTPLMTALSEKGFELNNKEHILVVCGDAFDRGDETIQVFEFLKQMKEQDRLVYITGNHEDLLFECMTEISYGKTPGSHHFSNGTVKTICQFTGENEWIVYRPTTDLVERIFESTQEVRDFIRENSVDYFELGDKLFVHSWIPCISDDPNMYHSRKTYRSIDPVWNKDPNTLSTFELIKYREAWRAARWGNPFTQWKQGFIPEGKCIIFGHWHVSWGHSHIDYETPEWPQKNQPKKYEAAFKPWVKDTAIGLDACCAESGKINCVVFDQNGTVLEV